MPYFDTKITSKQRGRRFSKVEAHLLCRTLKNLVLKALGIAKGRCISGRMFKTMYLEQIPPSHLSLNIILRVD